jgi:single-strand DNA-binding protein
VLQALAGRGYAGCLERVILGASVSSFPLATNRNWKEETGEKREETDFHGIVAWGKLGEICNQDLRKGRKVYVGGRLHSRQFTDSESITKSATQIVIDDMQMLEKAY